MSLGPVEVLEIVFPGNRFNGQILPELERLLDDGVITLIDGLLVTRDAAGEVLFVEFDDVGADDDARRLADLLDQVEAFISDDDVEHLAEALEPDSSAAILVIEHTWAKGFQQAVRDSGGVLAANFRVPGPVLDELMAELAAAD